MLINRPIRSLKEVFKSIKLIEREARIEDDTSRAEQEINDNQRHRSEDEHEEEEKD
jgi:hypothetical protein